MRQDLRARGAAAGVLALVLVAGVAIGFALDRDAPGAVADSAPTTRGSPGDRVEAPSEWIIDRLNLTPLQRIAVDSVVDHYGVRMSHLQREYRPRYRTLVDSTVHALRSLLTEDQRVRYDSLEASRERWRARQESGPRRDGP